MTLSLPDFKPHSKMVTKTTLIERPKFPVIDAHNHLGFFGGNFHKRPPQDLFAALDEAHVEVYVDLDGGWGEDILQERLDSFKAHAPARYLIFGGVDWVKWPEHGDRFGEYAAARLRDQARWGAQGLKIWKPFGLHVRDQHNALVKVDDSRLDVLWATAGELKLPVLAHVADPVAFFDPVDETNERWEELHAHPDWQFPSPPFPPFLDIVNAFARVVERHASTTFIGAHVGCYAEDLNWVSDVLKRCPNFFVDISARLGELGRQPYASRRFFIEHPDRILFGTDAGPNLDSYRLYYRFLETDDEYFNYNPNTDVPLQGRWMAYGLHLPDDVLRKVYAENAKKVIGNL